MLTNERSMIIDDIRSLLFCLHGDLGVRWNGWQNEVKNEEEEEEEDAGNELSSNEHHTQALMDV